MKVKFIGGSEYKAANSCGHIELTKDFNFFIDLKSYWLPRGYVCDGASIPRIFWSIIGSPFDPEKVPAAFCHDALYLTHAVSRPVADEVLFQLLLQGGCRLRTARTMWAAVRSFAYPAWTNNAQDKNALAAVRGVVGNRQDRDIFTSLWFA
jgi:hypothetical protein